MEEKDLFLSINKKRNRKKLSKQINNKSENLITSKIDIQKIIFIILIFINSFLIIKNVILNKKLIKNKNIFYFDNSIKENNEELLYNKPKRIFLYKEDFIDNDNNKNQIQISMAIDNNFIYPALVSMISALENNNKIKNIIIYHLFFSYNFDKKNIEIFDSLKNKYEVKINYYIIPNIFKNIRTWVGGTNTIYFKILLPLIFHDLKRMIYLDADTLILKDLLEMYKLPFNDNYILGYPFHDVNKIDNFVKNATYYINGGVLLFNIEKIRNDNKDIELIRFTFENNSQLWFLEQDSINVIFFQKIGLLPLKYGIYMYGDINSFEKSVQIRIRFKLNRTEVINAINDPSLVHFSCCNPKVWYKGSSNEFGVDSICKRFHNKFYYYANMSNYYQDIYNHYLK